jgi:hypothetical protein
MDEREDELDLLLSDEDEEDEYSDDTDEERAARAELEQEIDETSQQFVDKLIDKLMIVAERLSSHPWRKYQQPFARRIFESLIIGDGATLTALFARQTGKSETVANVIATCMIMLPRLARVFPDWLEKFKEGVKVGAFAPVDEQADTLYGRIIGVLEADSTAMVLADPDIGGYVVGKGRMKGIKFRGMAGEGSLVRKTTCHPRATIEGRTYHIILIDECQGADDRVVNKSVGPMGASTNATMVFTGTPTYTKNVFYTQIQQNKREMNKRGRKRANHFEVDWKLAAKENKDYRKFVLKEMVRMGEDSDEFKLSYRLIWLLDKGMFTTSAKLDACGDISMQETMPAWTRTPVVVGIDPARIQDKTVVTVVWVDWDHPDDLGYYHHRVLNWLDLEGDDWEEQYYKIVEFLSNYNIWKIGVDWGGVGDAVGQRLRLLMPGTEIVELGDAASEQSIRWKYLQELINRRQVVWPAGSRVRRLKMWRRFRQEMEDLEVAFKGPNMMAAAPNAKDAHDDYADSLAMACILTKEAQDESVVETYSNPFFERKQLY